SFAAGATRRQRSRRPCAVCLHRGCPTCTRVSSSQNLTGLEDLSGLMVLWKGKEQLMSALPADVAGNKAATSHTVEVSHVAKCFGDTQAVVDVSFEVERGEIFGLLGPNGAGKTTTIRLMLDIFRPDRGTVAILGGSMTEDKKERI